MPISDSLSMKAKSRTARQDTRDTALGLVLHLQPEALVQMVKLIAIGVREGHCMRYLTTDAPVLKWALKCRAVRGGTFKPPLSEANNNQLKWHNETDTKYMMNYDHSVSLIYGACAPTYLREALPALTNNGFLELYVCDMERKKRTRAK